MNVVIKAPAKVNIGLNVYQKTPSQPKHRIKSIFVLAHQYTDIIRIIDSHQLTIKYITEQYDLNLNNDIVTRTMDFLHMYFKMSINYEIIIEKHIPIRAGLGGSSADSGAIIRYFMLKEDLLIDEAMMLKIACELGSDIPFFISGYEMALVSHYGNIVKPINKPIPYFKIYANSIECDTCAIYAIFDKMALKQTKNKFHFIIKALPNLTKSNIINQLEIPAIQHNPLLLSYKKNGYIMTGSGSYFISFIGEKNHEN